MSKTANTTTERPIYPFTAIVGQEMMKQALVLNIINPSLSGVLIRGEKGTAKSTAVRALAKILPEIEVVEGCPFNRTADKPVYGCPCPACQEQIAHGTIPKTVKRPVPVVELPVGATEDRVVGTMDLEHALKKGEKQIEPGILAAAHRGILYVDEVNLLDDHVVDVLLDSAAMGVNTIEREGVSFTHPAKFTLVGTMNPEEGELRPQLLDRFGLCVSVGGITTLEDRVSIMERRADFENNPTAFEAQWQEESDELVAQIEKVRETLPKVEVSHELMRDIARYCLDVGVDGHRGDIIILKTAKTLAAYHNRTQASKEDIEAAAMLVLPHRIRRQPLQDVVIDVQKLRDQKKAVMAM